MNQDSYSPSYASVQGTPQVKTQKRGGCLSFFLGFLTGLFFPVILMGIVGVGFSLFGNQIITSMSSNVVQGYYHGVARDEIKNSLQLPESEKEEVMEGIDKMMENFPNMSPQEMQNALEQIVGQPQNLPSQNP